MKRYLNTKQILLLNIYANIAKNPQKISKLVSYMNVTVKRNYNNNYSNHNISLKNFQITKIKKQKI